MIRFSGVSHRFGEREVLTPFSLELAERRIAVIGANGSGKSTFARLINGLLMPSAGQVWVDDLDTKSNGKAVRGLVGFVFQNPDNQIVYPVVEEDIAFGLKNLKVEKGEIAGRVAASLARFGLSHLAKEQAHRLSGGEKQMLAIAGVTITQPRYIVFDEPTTLLDLRNKRLVARTIDRLDETAIVITHDLDLIADFDRVLVFEEGRIDFDGAPRDAIARYLELMA
ncbi:ATP-binding cassette domain-containing protein [Aliihoeflea aestuarii]|jgi:biotin transport system ATP-binding protein|uniref:energy-coupling factor ABC transporter ATP-binding protein n=1 Tax=Aliihoeflea aestuarii TaxID=453840 RepID=UPI002092B8CC|nr:ATP-binding cassette domain-containing protein [Aliihoeflea aestuarii]MCO6391922.1 ATP-binding cassette domain-containing protein [Aliihoeflea aestuarii]